MSSDGWRSCRLADVIEFQRGFDLAARVREPGDVPVVASAGVTGRHSCAKVSAPGVVTGRYGTIGRVFFVEEDFWPLNTTLWVKDFKGADPRFIYYWLQAVDFRSVSAKSVVPGVDRNDLHEFQVTVPGVDKQRRIAAVLGALDAKIEHDLRIARRLRDLVRVLADGLLSTAADERWPLAAIGECRLVRARG